MRAFALQIVSDRAAQARIGDVMRRIGRDRAITTRELMLALRAGFDTLQAVRDGVFDGLIVTNLKMQERMMLDRAPMAPVERLRTDEIDRARDPVSGAPGHDQQNAIRHALPD